MTERESEDVLTEIRERYDLAESEWSSIRDEGDTDLNYVAGDPWADKDRKAREAAGRPCLSFDEAGQYLNQVINSIRANPRAVKFTPTGNGANDKTAEFYANKMRDVEYRSHAQLGYTTAFQNCVERSYGWVRLTTKYENDDSDNQDICIEPVENPNMVLPDPFAKRPDGSDLRYLFFQETIPISEFTRRWPKAKVTTFDMDTRAIAPSWFTSQNGVEAITVAEYWTKEPSGPKKLVLAQTPQGPQWIPAEQLAKLPANTAILRERSVETSKVTQYITNGIEILETNQWKGQYIPFASCFGKVIYLKGVRKILSMMRLARDPIMAHAYMETCEAEIVGGVPRNSFIGYTGQFHDPNRWQKAAHEPVAFLEADPFTEATGANAVLPLPQRQSWDPPIQNIEIAIEGKRRSIQAAIMGSPLPTTAQRHNEKSGVALQQIEKSGQIGSFHFADHYDDMIRHVGVIYEDLCDKIYDAARNTTVREPDGAAKTVRINDPKPDLQGLDPITAQRALKDWQGRQPPGYEGDGISTKGAHAVTVSSGPAADSQREAVSDFIGSLMAVPAVQQMAPDLVVRLQGATMNLGPLMEELADRITPPQFKKPKPGEGPDPQQIMQQAQQLGQENAQLKGMIAKLTQEITTKQVEQQGQLQKANIDADKAMAIAVMDNATKLAVARISASKDLDKTALLAQEEAIALNAAAAMQGHTQAHELGMARVDHDHAMEQAQQAHDQGLEAADQGHQQTLEAAQQQAALTPPEQPGA